jgi:predicted ATPase
MHLSGVRFHPERYPTKDRYPFHLPIFHRTEVVSFSRPITLFVGENGTGKSTLIQALCRKCGIHIWQETARTRAAVNPYERAFSDYLSVTWTGGRVPGSYFGSDTFRHFSEILDEWAAADPGQLAYFGGASLLTQSHGQSLMSFFRSRYRITGLYMMDEPETALSPRSQLELLALLQELAEGGHAQFIIATHSPLLLACPRALIYSFDGETIGTIRYEETEHYRIYKDFLTDRSRYLRQP